MKGYHVDLAKNKAVKNNQSPETKINQVKIHSLVKETVAKKEELYASKTEIVADNKNKTSIKNLSAVKKFKALTLNNNVSKTFKETKTIKHSMLKSLIETKTKLVKGLETRTNNRKSVPFDSFCSGGGGGGIVPVLIGIVASILFTLLIFGLLSLILGGGGTIPIGATVFLVVIGIIIVVAVIAVIVINGD